MVKSINVYFDDEEYEELLKLKGDLSWHDFIWNNRKSLATSPAIDSKEVLK